MKNIASKQRLSLQEAAIKHEISLSSDGSIPFWDETHYYEFTSQEIENGLVGPSEEIEKMCFEVIDRAMSDESIMSRLEVDRQYWDLIADSWHDGERNLYGRMDFSYDGVVPAKLLEYNADTPTTLYESAIFQWEWYEEMLEDGALPTGADQFNEIHESLVGAFGHIGSTNDLHLASSEQIEDDRTTIEYLAECASEAGLQTHLIDINDIGISAEGRFLDCSDQQIKTLFKLYPWEWIFSEEFGAKVYGSGTKFIEPPWRSILSNKGLLPVLWEMFEGHPNLLPAYFEDDPRAQELSNNVVRKPLLGRQGANVEIQKDGKLIQRRDGPYEAGPFILQELHQLPEFNQRFPLLGCWVVASRAVGLGIREDQFPITGPEANFVPHIILD